MKILQINSVVNSGSTGRIAEDIGKVLMAHGHESYIAYGRGNRPSNSNTIKIGTDFDVYAHGAKTLLFDLHGFGSKSATLKLIQQIEKIGPDIIGLHNLHGYYLHIGILFDYLRKSQIPVLWTLFDCWAFTGHCTYFDDINCEKWMTHCVDCPKSRNYPRALVDNSFRNFADKKQLFSGLKNMELIVHSNWLSSRIEHSFLKDYPVHVMASGVDIDVFKPTSSTLRKKYGFEGKNIILGCASIWTNRKGYQDFINLYQLLDNSFQIVMIGLNNHEIKQLPKGILGLPRTERIEDLAKWYTVANVFVNPTSQDNFPTTNLEALACGTPVVTYRTGGSPEAIDDQTGIVVEKGDIKGLYKAICQISEMGKPFFEKTCRDRALKLFNKSIQYQKYLNLYINILNKSNV